jgi:NAD(P)H-dependent FMN reductase
MRRVSVLVGSLSGKSVNRSLARALTKLPAPALELVEVNLGEIPRRIHGERA